MVDGPFAVLGEHCQPRITGVLSQGAGPSVKGLGALMAIAVVHDGRFGTRDRDTGFLLPLLCNVIDGWQQGERALEMRLGLGEGRPADRRLAGFVPPADRPPGFSARLRVLGKDLGRRRATGLENVEQAAYAVASTALEQALVRGVAHQGMLEEVGRVRRRSRGERPVRPPAGAAMPP